MSEYVPDRWMLVKITNQEAKSHYRVFASWYGGYLGSDSWKLNSGVTHVDEDENSYLFHGSSGSVYKCHKTSYGISGYGMSVLSNMIAEANEDGINIDMLPHDTNPLVLEYNQGVKT